MSKEGDEAAEQAVSEFQSWRSYSLFRQEVARTVRYVRTPETTKFLEAVAQSARSRVLGIQKGRRFYRAAVTHHDEMVEEIEDVMPAPALPSRMMPLPDRATEGRINPKGIPCLYMASHAETAIAEVRPWIGSFVSVAILATLREQRVVDCTNIGSAPSLYFFEEPEPPPQEREQAVWNHIARAFREPVTRNDDRAEYAATQILAEVFRSHGFDGVAYRSAFGTDRYNVALFDLNAAELLSCSLHEITDVDFKYRETANPYFVQMDENGEKAILRNVIAGIYPADK
ncbi:MAG: RES family NAD+ phosphorylase [Methylocystis sp.]